MEGLRCTPEWTWTLEGVSSSTGRVLADAGPVAPVGVEQTLIRYDRCVIQEEYRLKQNSVTNPLRLAAAQLVGPSRVLRRHQPDHVQ